jgi:hypothetical protein
MFEDNTIHYLTPKNVDDILSVDKRWILLGHVRESFNKEDITWLEETISEVILSCQKRELFECLEKDLDFMLSQTAFKFKKNLFALEIEIITPTIRKDDILSMYIKHRSYTSFILKSAWALLGAAVAYVTFKSSVTTSPQRVEEVVNTLSP